jgi:serine/threonine protein kinase
MAPEALRGAPLDHRADIWSAGVVLWEMTLGRRLYRGKPEQAARRVLDEAVPVPTQVTPEYPPALAHIVMKALEKDVDERYSSARRMMQDLEDFLAESGQRPTPLRIGHYLRDLFGDAAPPSFEVGDEWSQEDLDLAETRPRLEQTGDTVPEIAPPVRDAPLPDGGLVIYASRLEPPGADLQAVAGPDAGSAAPAAAPAPGFGAPFTRPRGRAVTIAAVALGVAATAGLLYWLLS